MKAICYRDNIIYNGDVRKKGVPFDLRDPKDLLNLRETVGAEEFDGTYRLEEFDPAHQIAEVDEANRVQELDVEAAQKRIAELREEELGEEPAPEPIDPTDAEALAALTKPELAALGEKLGITLDQRRSAKKMIETIVAEATDQE